MNTSFQPAPILRIALQHAAEWMSATPLNAQNQPESTLAPLYVPRIHPCIIARAIEAGRQFYQTEGTQFLTLLFLDAVGRYWFDVVPQQRATWENVLVHLSTAQLPPLLPTARLAGSILVYNLDMNEQTNDEMTPEFEGVHLRYGMHENVGLLCASYRTSTGCIEVPPEPLIATDHQLNVHWLLSRIRLRDDVSPYRPGTN